MKTIICYVVNHPVFISALAALVSLGFSIFVYFRTRHLLKQRERPMLLSEGTGVRGGEVTFSFKNWGEHPAQNVGVTCESAPKGKPGEFKIRASKRYLNKIAPRQSSTLSFQRGGTEDLIIRFSIRYEDAFTKKAFVEPIWLEYDRVSMILNEPTEDDIRKILPYEKDA